MTAAPKASLSEVLKIIQPGEALPDGTVYLGKDMNGVMWAVTAKDHPGLYHYSQAQECITNINAKKTYGHQDFQLMSLAAGNLAWENRHCGLLESTFRYDRGYWLAEPDRDGAWSQWFDDGSQNYGNKANPLTVRPARRLYL